MQSMMKMRQDNDVTDRIGLLYPKNETKFHDRSKKVWSIMKTRQDNNVIDHIGTI